MSVFSTVNMSNSIFWHLITISVCCQYNIACRSKTKPLREQFSKIIYIFLHSTLSCI